MKWRLFLAGFLCVSMPSVVTADEPCSIAFAQDVLACAMRCHPEVVRAEAALRAARALEDAARQQPNPEADAQVTSSQDPDRPALKVEASLLHTFELGRKRSRRAEEARSRLALAQAELLRAKEKVALQTVLDLHRLRQLQLEVQTLEEGIHTFGKVVQAFRLRSILSAEQEVSLNVFGLAQSEHALRKSSLLQERASLEASFETATGLSLEKLAAVLPPERLEWPALEVTGAPIQSAARREAEGSLQLSQAQQAVASSAAWPDLKAGPRLEADSGHGQNSQGYGVTLALSLPLYQRNEGARQFAQRQVETAETVLTQKNRELKTERRKWAAIYEQALAAYRQEPSLEEVQEKHHSLEKLFERGLVSASLVIEAHRQLAEYVKARHEKELQALKALWSVRALDGTLLNERL